MPVPAALHTRSEVSLAEARLGHRLAGLRVGPPARSEAIQASLAEERPSGEHLAPAGRGQPLPEAVRGKMEAAFGHDFSRVRIHEGRTSESLGAVAFTRGQDVHFAPGRYSPASRGGQELLGHELAHVVQQAHGRVAVPQGKGAPINADPALEAEADLLGRQAARGLLGGGRSDAAGGAEGGAATGRRGRTAIQRQPDDKGKSLREKVKGGFGWLTSGLIGRNFLKRYQALKNPLSVDPNSRLGALIRTKHFPRGTSGYGAHGAIGAIHSLLGGIGQSNIGAFFGSSRIQSLLAQPSRSLGNLKASWREYVLWRRRLGGTGAVGPSTIGETFGGVLGSLATPSTRAFIQHTLAHLPRGVAHFPAIALGAWGLRQGRSALPKDEKPG